MADGLRSGGIAASELPLADGGEGTLDVLLGARKGRRLTTRVTGPLGDPVQAEWGLLADGTAVIEMAQASGLALVERNDPLRRTPAASANCSRRRPPRRHARDRCVGGSASTDGGLGASTSSTGALPLNVTVACDVETRFVDAARVFGPQKGATATDDRSPRERLARCARRYGIGDLARRRRRGRARRRAGRARRDAALRLRRRRRRRRAARAPRGRRPGRHRRGRAGRVEPRRQGRRRRARARAPACASAVIAGHVDVDLDTTSR